MGFLLARRSSAASGLSYSTTFPSNENPISESGNWTNTISGTFTAPVSTTGGHAVGLDSTGFNDSIAMLVGAYGRDQTITATAYRGGSSGAAEIELHCRMTMTPGAPDTIKTYEFDILPSVNGAVIVKWDGTQGTFTNLAETASLGGVSDGDVFEASAIGPSNATVLTLKKNGVQLVQFTDTSGFPSGNPGIGFDAGTQADGANLGWADYSVVTSN